MRKLFILVVALVALAGVVFAAVGVLRVHNSDEQINVTIDKKELKEKAGEAVEKSKEVGSEILDKTSGALQKAKESLDSSKEHNEGRRQ